MTTCKRCGVKKEHASRTGSLLCDECQEKQFAKIRKIVKERKNKMSINTVKKYMDDGLKPKEIAEKTGLKINTVYSYMYEIRKNNEEANKKTGKESTIDEMSANRNDDLLSEAQSELIKLRIELEAEKRKHKALLDYVIATATDKR